jgi:hypothetical protein
MKYRAQAESTPNAKAGMAFKTIASKTLTGINAYDAHKFPKSAFPGDVRPYIDDFVAETDKKERRKILEAVSPDVGRAIAQRWEFNELQGLRAKQQATGLSWLGGESSRKAQLEELAANQGYERGLGDELGYRLSRNKGESYPDYKRRQEVDEYFKKHEMPSPNFVGFHPGADLEDFKLARILNAGADMHDHNIWDDRKRSLMRKPFVMENFSEIDDQNYLPTYNAFNKLRTTLYEQNRSARISYGTSSEDPGDMNMEISDTREPEVQAFVENAGD